MKPKIFHLSLAATVILILMSGCGKSITPQRYVHKAVAIIDKTALFAEGPSWEETKKHSLSATPETMDEAHEIVRETLKVAGGKHSFLMEQSMVEFYDTLQWKMPVIENIEDSILVITVPDFSGDETQAKQYTRTLLDAISPDVRQVILDLRGNTGGNMYPMIAGVNALLPDDVILKFRRSNGLDSKLTAGYIAKVQGVERKAPITPQIAILTDGDTASSGEALLICFRGMSNVRTFGSPTAGYASANRTFDMGDGSRLVITSGCDVARTGEVFCDDPIVPDCLTDTPMNAAIEWLKMTKDSPSKGAPLKPRLVVLTDIGPADVEPDDNESAVRLLSYADRFEIEAICTTIGWNCDPYPEDWADYLFAVIEAYEKDVNNLMKRSNQKGFRTLEEENARQELGYWPSAEYIRSRAMSGSHIGGIGVIGEDNDSEGSNMLIRLADEDDPRPIYVTAWGGANTLSQAIWRVQQTRSPEEVKAFLNKFRLYTITDQDMVYAMRMDRDYSSHKWLRRDFEDDLLFVWDESAWLNQNALGVQNWDKYAEFIQGKGSMGKVYPHYLWGVEGDTPSFLNAMPNGLNDPDDPAQVGWGGCHEKHLSPDGETSAWTNWHQPLKDISNAYEHKFYPDEFNDFAARMQWADTGKGNHNPTPVVNGSQSLKPLTLTAKAGKTLKLDASASFDEDGDSITFDWWFQEFPDVTDYPAIDNAKASEIEISIPKSAATGCRYDLVCEIHDDGAFSLPAYRRIIITVR